MLYLLVITICLIIFTIGPLLFKRLGLVDIPDGQRKQHSGSIPLSGGFCILMALGVSVFLADYLEVTDTSRPSTLILASFFALPVFLIGLIDDIKPRPPLIRLIIQIISCWGFILTTDIYVRDLGDLLGFGNIYLGELGIPITIFMVVGITNATNMFDGFDGIVGSVAFWAWTCLSLIALTSSAYSLTFIPSIVFAIYFFFSTGIFGKRVKMFLGDSGALTIGFIASLQLVVLTQGEQALFSPVCALYLVLLPLIDALTTFISRLKAGKPIYKNDRRHFHFILYDSGVSKAVVILIISGMSMLATALCLYGHFSQTPEYIMFYGFLTIWFFYFLFLNERTFEN